MIGYSPLYRSFRPAVRLCYRPGCGVPDTVWIAGDVALLAITIGADPPEQIRRWISVTFSRKRFRGRPHS